jgi:hypothetical protein
MRVSSHSLFSRLECVRGGIDGGGGGGSDTGCCSEGQHGMGMVRVPTLRRMIPIVLILRTILPFPVGLRGMMIQK